MLLYILGEMTGTRGIDRLVSIVGLYGSCATYLPGTLAYSIHPAVIPSVSDLSQFFVAHPDKFNQRIVNPRSMGKPEAAPRAKLVEEEQFLFLGTSLDPNSRIESAANTPFLFSCGLASQPQRGELCAP